jgi:sugar phosphate isomerase/epimerase
MIELPGPSLAVTIAPIAKQVGSVQRAIESVRNTGVGGVQLSASLPGIRPRDLDGRARRDVLALLARQGLTLAGVDLMIPHGDYLKPATQDRAFEAMLAAMELAYDWGKVTLSTTMPVGQMPADLVRELLVAADARGITLAVHAEHDLEGLEQFLKTYDQPSLGAAIDPAALLAEGHEPEDVVGRFADRLVLARLDDHAQTSVTSSGGRVPVGGGALDVAAYRAALSIARRLKSIVIELRDLPDPLAGAAAARSEWQGGGLGF